MSTYVRYPLEIRAQAIYLRQQGYSLQEISGKLQIRKATIWCWTKSLVLSDKAKNRIKQRIINGGKVGRPLAAKVNRQKIERWKEEIQKKALIEVKESKSFFESGRLFCALLYLCEGSRYPAARMLGFGNSNPKIIRLFLYLLRRYFSVDERKFRCWLSYRCDQSQENLISYWSRITRIKKSKFYLRQPDLRTKGKPTLRKDYRGVCVIQYMDTTLQFTLQSLGEAIAVNMVEQEGFEPSAFWMPSRRAPSCATAPRDIQSKV